VLNHSAPELDVLFKDEIRNALVAIDQANRDIADEIDTREMRLYRKGYSAAISALAAVFGIDLSDRPANGRSLKVAPREIPSRWDV